jgi:hypothetical protein
MKKFSICLLLMFTFLTSVWADNFSDARKAYDAKDYAKAARLFEAATKEKNDAMSHYGLGLSYLRLKRNADAVKPLETAQQLDPSLKFAPNKQFFEQRLAEARGGSKPAGNSPFADDPQLGQAVNDLVAGKTLMDYTGTLTPTDKSEIEKHINEANSKGFKLRVFVVSPPRKTNLRNFATRDIKQVVNLSKDDILIVSAPGSVYVTGQRGGSELDSEELNRLIREAAPFSQRQEQGRSGMGLGLAELSRLLVAEARSDRTTRQTSYGFLGLLGVGAAGAGVAFVVGRRKLQQKSYKNKLDESINLLMNEINDKLGKEFDVNARFVNWQKEYEEIKATNTWKDHTRIDRLNATLQDAVRQPERYFDYLPGIKEIKEAAAKLGAPPPPQKNTEDVFDYFDGRPLKKEEAVVVALKDRDGQEIRVLTSRAHADEMGQGQTPKVLTREVDGRRVHWSNDPSYDPRRDYRPYDPYQRDTSWVDIWMMSQLFSPHTYYGPAIYPYYNNNYYYSQPYYQQPTYDAPRDWNGDGVIDFGESERHYNEPVYHPQERGYQEPQQSYDSNSGGMDFGWGGGSSNDSADSSWASSDSSSDWGSSSGGSDWGGGGSDFGGGSDSGSGSSE